MCESISRIFSTELVSSSVDCTRFSTPRITPSDVATCLRESLVRMERVRRSWAPGYLTPIAVEPCLIASREYSTWKRRPSGENVLDGC